MRKMQKAAAIVMSAMLLCATAVSFVGCSEKSSQTSAPQKGDTVATITFKNFGDVKIKLFPQEAPKAVENFTTHAKDGYYDGLTMHRVMNNFMIQGGDPTGNGTGGESIWGKAFEDEFSDNLKNISGALSMANSGANTNGSQFFLVKTDPVKDVTQDGQTVTADQIFEFYETSYGITISEEDRKLYKQYGGTPWLDGVHTVFGQIYEGLDLVQNIMNVKVDANNMPAEPVVIEKITISTVE